MNWNQELLNSALWLGKTFAITLVVFVLVMGVLARTTSWGRQFWSLSGAYFSPKRSWRPLLGLALLLLCTLFAVRMNVLFSFWYNDFYSAMQALDQPKFWFSLNLFGILAAIHVVRALATSYIRSAFVIHWRLWLNERTVGEWLGGQSYYLGRFAQPAVDNPDQRIQQDVTTLVGSTLTLALGLVGAVVSVYEFTGILWKLSASMTVFGTEVPRAMVFLVYLYVLVASFFAFRIGRPLIELNFLNEKFTANYRYLLVRVREYGESIALYRGERVEQRGLLASFAAVIANAWVTLWRALKFEGYNLVISQISVVFPFIIQAPRLFSGAIKLGDVMQTSQSFGQLADSLSFFRSSYDDFAGYRAVLDRLSGFEQNVAASARLSLPEVKENASALVTRKLTVNRPDGQALLRDLDLTLTTGQALLIRGPSGSGKTTLLRTLAGLWPFSTGESERPTGAASLFLSQRPYLPVGSLRAALAYPAETVSDDVARQVLAQVQLGQLADQLDVVQDWSQVLSPGEQQRLAFGRALANRPAIIFLDEATSATDSGLEHALYGLLRTHLPQAILVSVGHRQTLVAFHDQALTFTGEGRWVIEPVG
ncbi:ABC transporter ATP-binding protein/permease [Sphaerotilus sp.]|uniref:ABC transporter ATP-binding protein/permease n=1 Tax=Sphaerotilus sp. TaxID=2093942 RepID=UPI0025F215BD|nr:ABC transporter ATP-binding protein/permease [Sphaerotilus sp.]